jgi:hypothetical protein
VVPIRKRDHGVVYGKISAKGTFSPEDYPTIVNVVQTLMGIIWILDNQSPTQAITVLVPEVAVIPECPLK